MSGRPDGPGAAVASAGGASAPALAGRLHPVGALVVGLRWLGKGLVPIVIAVATSGSLRIALIVLAVVVALVVPAAVMWWRRFEFRVAGDRLELRQGVLQRRRRTIALDRIRGVEIVANPLQRMFGVVGLQVEAAAGGGDDAEVSLPALARGRAAELRAALLTGGVRPRRDGRDAPEAERELARVRLRTVALGGVTELGYVLAPLAALGALISVLDDIPSGVPRRIGEAVLDRLPDDAGGIAALAGLAVVLAAAIGALGGILVDGGFLLRERGGRLVSERGLLTRRRTELDRERVRGVEIRDNPPRRALGLASLRAVVGGIAAGKGDSRGRTTLLPVGRRDQTWRLARRFAAGAGADLLPHPPAGLPRRMIRALPLPLVGLGASIALRQPTAIAVTAVATVVMAVVAWDRQRNLGHSAGDGRLALRSGSLDRRHTVVDDRAVVAYRVRSSPGQRRRGLCTLEAALPQPIGARAAIDLSEDQAREVLLAGQPEFVRSLLAR